MRRASAAARPHGGGARRRGLLCPVQMASVAPATPIAPTSADAASRTSQEIQLVPARKFKPMPKRRNCATLKKRPFIQVNKNPTLQKCEHVPSVVKHRQIVFPPAPSRQTPGAALDLRCGNYPHPVPRATTKCPTSLYVRQLVFFFRAESPPGALGCFLVLLVLEKKGCVPNIQSTFVLEILIFFFIRAGPPLVSAILAPGRSNRPTKERKRPINKWPTLAQLQRPRSTPPSGTSFHLV